jgi:transcriptional regulator with XRE-family HTH domain
LDIADRIKTIRGKLSQEEFAQRVGVHKSSLGRYERGTSVPDLDFLSSVCSEFGVNPQWLLQGIGPVYDATKTQLVHRTTGGGPNAVRCGEPTSEMKLTPEYQEWLEQMKVLEARVAALEKELAEAKEAVIEAQKDSVKAYKLAVDALRSTRMPQLGDEDAYERPTFQRRGSPHVPPRPAPHQQNQSDDKK